MNAEHRPASRTYWLVDLENTHSRWTLASGQFRAGDIVVLFWSPSASKVPLEDVSEHDQISYKFIKCFNGSHDALDFQLSAWLGRMSILDPSARFVILSGDHGYEPLVRFLAKAHVDAALTDPSTFATDMAPAKMAAHSSPENTAVPEPTGDASMDSIWLSYHDKLMAFGVSDPQELSAMSDILYISMQSPQNKRKLGVRNRMMARYGTQEGNLRYNALKELIHEIANDGPYPEPRNTVTPSSLDTHRMNVALGQAGITLKTGQAAKAVKAVAEAMCAKSPNDVIYKAVGDIFDKDDHQKANRVLRSFLDANMKRGA